ncbi:Yip1 domain-containing protein [Sulfitobacter marinus]|uniref:Yip1 domain-containing protein n=1 Tax=Sulfitobacter marinus TaxID=394264 RepID=A0A1I6QBX5_9RHOB|nr:Yip1 family protein [Sulfitobacter marinus]SFS49977.1 Yip1 domain-containing protein [Sulfitobacter marinus]
MNLSDLRLYLIELVVLSLRDPRKAAEQIIGWQLDRDVLWTGLALAAAANTIVFSVSVLLQPSAAMPLIFTSPLAIFLLLAGVLAITVHGLYWTGRAIGGTGSLGDVLSVILFLQVLRVMAQIVIFLVMFVAPTLSFILSLITGILGVWILVNFIAAAHRFDSLGRAVATLLISMAVIVLGLSFLLSIIGIFA